MTKTEIPRIHVEPRQRLGSRYAGRLRTAGRLPAVIYGHGQDPVHVSVDRKEITTLLHRNTHLLEVQIDAQTEPCLIKDVQWNHLGSEIIHVDLSRVNLTERVSVEVEIELTGEAAGLKESGAILEQPLQTLEVQCLATEIPQNIKVDVSGLNVDESLTVGEIKLPEGMTTKEDPETIVAAVHVVLEEAAPEMPAEGAAEPEVIGRKPAEEGAAAEAPAKGEKKK